MQFYTGNVMLSNSSPHPSLIHNIGLLAHVDAGKTSITERILYLAGLKREAGDVDEGTTATDYLSVERKHGITVKSAAVRLEWNGAVIHLIDTPGHVDFGIEVERAVRVLDGAVIALCAVSGVQARTEAISLACSQRSLPRMYFVNKMDREGADFWGVLANLREQLEPSATAIQYPLYEGRTWIGIADLVTRDTYRFDDPGNGDKLDFPPDAEARRIELVEALAEYDENAMARFADDEDLQPDELKAALSAATKRGDITPVLCGSAFQGSSVSILLDSLLLYLPSASEAAIPKNLYAEIHPNSAAHPEAGSSLAAFVFKTFAHESGDVIAWARIWSGSLAPGKRIFDARLGKDVFIRKIYGIQADSLTERSEAGPGEVVGLRAAVLEPGSSLCERSSPVLFERLVIPEPVMSQVVEPRSPEDLAPLRKALESLALEDGSLFVKEERETGRFVISGQGELHLGIAAERLKREFGISARLGNPRINCKERLRRSAAAVEDFDRDFGGERVRTRVEARVEPSQKEGTSVSEAPGLRLAPHYAAAARRGAGSSAEVGPAEGWPMEGVRVSILALEPPPASTGKNGEIAVEAASALAVRRAMVDAGSIVLEPVMAVAVECSEASFGAVLNALVHRRGRVESVEDRLSVKAVSAKLPMSRLIGFDSELRSLSAGKASFQAIFSGYEPREGFPEAK
ncbi:MAG TPA: GTP-binding protein [Rectinemataceae bacterium]